MNTFENDDLLEKVYIFENEKWEKLKLISKEKHNKIIDSIGDLVQNSVDFEKEELKAYLYQVSKSSKSFD